MTLDADLRVHRGSFTLDIRLTSAAASVLGLVGPNGSGKTTALRALAGLTPLAAGHVMVSRRTLEDPAAMTRLPVPARGVGMVFQDRLLFPHLDVLDNVAYGIRARGTDRKTARSRAWNWLERTELTALADRRPAAISGGQAQRVAITRALASEPGLLLLDEPLASLDASASASLRSFLRRHLQDFAGVCVVVTHDALDALVLTDQVVVLDRGRIEQAGPPAEVAREPRSAHVAALMGLNLLRGNADAGVVSTPDGAEVAVAGSVDGEVFCSFPPTAVTISTYRPHASARNVWPGRIEAMSPRGDTVRLQVSGPVPLLADVTPPAVADLRLDVGREVWAAVKAVEIAVYPA